jgi:exosortase A
MDVQDFPSAANVNGQHDCRGAWQLSIAITAITLVTLVALFWNTAASAINLWWERPTYSYAFLILPISAYLIWVKRDEVGAEAPTGSLWGVGAVASFGLLWLTSNIAELNEGRHIAFIGMMLGILLACLGWRVFKILSFPFLYLWLLVPTGTVLLPLLQQITTSISSDILRWLAIPVYTEDFFIEVPSGHYHIAPGCAGLNFILAAAALAPLYAYLFYRSFWKRLIVVLLALVLAVVMNGVRVAGIIALAHWGGPRLNIVDDHLLYGWGFFALVLFGAGYAGSFFADRESSIPSKKQASLFRSKSTRTTWSTAIAGSLSLLVVVATFVLAKGISSSSAREIFEAPASIEAQDWHKIPWLSDWSPTFSNADIEIRQSYARDGETVDLFLAGYAYQAKGRKMISYDNSIIDQTRWSIVGERHRQVDFASRTLPLAELVIAADDQRRLVWLFYWVDGTSTADPMIAKLLEIKAKLFFGDQRAATIAVATPESAGQDNADRILQSFLKEALPQIETLLTQPTRPM